jgi:pilus assembly protein TadC
LDFSVKKALKKLNETKKVHKAEDYLVDALFQMSSTSYFLPPEEMLLDVVESDYGLLSKELKIVYNEIMNGEDWIVAFNKLKKRMNSSLVSKAVDVINTVYETGVDAGASLREVAEEISQQKRIQRQRSSSLIMQKITLLVAGAFIIPLILGVLVSMVKNFDFSGISSFGLKQMNLGSIVLANQIYLVEYGLIASGFISYEEEKLENFLKYFFLMVPIALILFNLTARGLINLF